MATLYRWLLWTCVVLFASTVFLPSAGLNAYRLPGLRALYEDMWIAVPVFLLVLSSALVLTIRSWRTIPNCFIFGGALAASAVALFIKVGGGGLALICCGTALVNEGRRLLSRRKTGLSEIVTRTLQGPGNA